jgi:hypothetical protein
MIRKNFMLTQKHSELLRKEAQNQQVSMSEILRKALDMFFSKGGKP